MDIGFTKIGFTTSLRNRITVDSQNDGNVFQVGVMINGKQIYLATLYGEDCKAYFYDLDILVSEYMRSNALTLAKLQVHGYYESGMESVEVWVVYTASQLDSEDHWDLLESHFLTTRSYYTVPRGHSVTLNFLIHTYNYEQTEGVINACFELADGSVHTEQLTISVYDYQDTRIYNYGVSSHGIENLLKRKYPNDSPRVLAASVHFGRRSMDFYFVDEQPVDILSFRNMFNIWEYFYVYGTQTIKSDFDNKIGSCSGRSVAYNRTSTRKVEVETVPLGLEEADWLNQFLGSPSVCHHIVDADEYVDIILSDISSEISDSAKDQVTLKFSWQYADPLNWQSFPVIPYSVFNSKYNDTFR